MTTKALQEASPELIRIVEDVLVELRRAQRKFPRAFVNLHEAFAVLEEERDELWTAIKRNHNDGLDAREQEARAEAVQVAAMAVRMILDCVDCKPRTTGRHSRS